MLGENLITPGRTAAPDEEEKMKASLIEQIRSLEARFATDDQLYVCGTENPSAADFTLVRMVD